MSRARRPKPCGDQKITFFQIFMHLKLKINSDLIRRQMPGEEPGCMIRATYISSFISSLWSFRSPTHRVLKHSVSAWPGNTFKRRFAAATPASAPADRPNEAGVFRRSVPVRRIRLRRAQYTDFDDADKPRERRKRESVRYETDTLIDQWQQIRGVC